MSYILIGLGGLVLGTLGTFWVMSAVADPFVGFIERLPYIQR